MNRPRTADRLVLAFQADRSERAPRSCPIWPPGFAGRSLCRLARRPSARFEPLERTGRADGTLSQNWGVTHRSRRSNGAGNYPTIREWIVPHARRARRASRATAPMRL